MSAPPCWCWAGNAARFLLCWTLEADALTQHKSNPNHIFHQIWCWDSCLLNKWAWRMTPSCHSQVNHSGVQALFAHGWFLEPTPSAPQRWEHCRWWLNQITDSLSLFNFLWTCIAAGDQASSSESSHSLDDLRSWVLAARSKPLNDELPFRLKGMAKSQNGQACIVP